MADLNLDFDDLTTLESQLSLVRLMLENAEKFSSGVADLTGDDQLAQVVRDFAEKWNLRRGFMIDDLEHLGAASEAIRDTFRELDGQIAGGLAGGGGGGGGR
jgi:hypothetical protein